MAGDNRPERKLRMSDSEDLASKERRRRLIERLNEKEKLIGLHSPAQHGQMSEEELAAEIEKQRILNAARGGGDPVAGKGGRKTPRHSRKATTSDPKRAT
jgi:hypothetical protein